MSNTHNEALAAGQDDYDSRVAYLRNTPDEVAVISTVRDRPGIAIRSTFRNGWEFSIDAAAMKWFLRHDLKDSGDDFLPALVALLARRVFRDRGGKKLQGCSLQGWLVGREYHAARAD